MSTQVPSRAADGESATDPVSGADVEAAPALPEPYRSQHKIRLVTATSLFDGHDASINIMRRICQASGAEEVRGVLASDGVVRLVCDGE